MATKLEKLLQKEAQLKAQIQQAKAVERTMEKKRDTRRKILIGAAVMARVDNGEWPKADLEMMMDGFLTRPNERELFNLDSSPDDEAATGDDSGARSAVAEAKKADGNKEKSEAIGEFSTARKKATKEKLRVQREKEAKATTQKKKVGSISSGLSEPDFDVDKEFNL